MQPSPFLRTRLARRILGLFLLCAVLPVTALAILGYSRVASDLEEAELQRLRAEAKSSGMMLLDRLNTLATRLDNLAWLIQAGPRMPRMDTLPVTDPASPRFLAVLVEQADGSLSPVNGRIDRLPPIGGEVRERLLRGGVGLVTARGPDGPRVFLVRESASAPKSRVWGLVDGASVWGESPESGIAPSGASLCLTATDVGALTCGMVHGGDDRQVTGEWTVFLKHLYGAPAWSLQLGTAEAVVFEPLRRLRTAFAMGLGLALAVVFVLSHVQLRRRMQPLEALEAGTKRVAEGRFDEPVTVGSDDELGDLADAFNRMSAELSLQFRQGRALEAVHQAALQAKAAEPVLKALFGQRRDLIPGGGLSVALARPDDPFWWRVSHQSGSGAEPASRDLRPTPSELGELAAAREGIVARRGERARSYFPFPGRILEREALVLPLWRGEALSGVLVVPCEPGQEGRPGVLSESRRAADRVAVAIAHAQSVEQLAALNLGALTALARTIDAASPWTAGHSERVTQGALEIGNRLRLSEDDLELMHRGGLLHDIGKVGVPMTILDKPDKLTPEEYAVIKEHPTIGARILAPIGPFRPALPLVLHHHELLDGSGYPHGLAGEAIPPLVRILTVADVFDALVSDRPYRTAWTVDRAIAHLRESAGLKFDAAAVEALAEAVSSGWRPHTSTPAEPVSRERLGRSSLWSDSLASHSVQVGA